MNLKLSKEARPWTWVPTLYFAEGLPYVIIMTISVLMYKRLGLSNTDAAYYTSWLYLPWVIKPFWSPIVDVFRSKRWWILIMQLVIGAGLAGVAFTLPTSSFLQWSLAFFYLMAFSSATHDIAADGFYMLALDEHEQSLFVGIRSTFYRIATVAGQGLLLMLVNVLEVYTRKPAVAWSYIFYLTSALFLLVCLYHYFVLPKPKEDADHKSSNIQFSDVWTTFITFFKKPQAAVAIIFMLLFRLPEALITKICTLFLNDNISKGGLGLSTGEVGWAQGTIGVIGLTIGGILGGIVVSNGGFKKWLWPMVMAITLPDCVYLFLAYYQPESMIWVNLAIGIEQFGYGFGFTAYMLFMLYFSQGESKTAHYAFCTGFMALSMMLPGMVAGWLADKMGYYNFFILVMCLVPLTFLAASLIKVPADFGLKSQEENFEDEVYNEETKIDLNYWKYFGGISIAAILIGTYIYLDNEKIYSENEIAEQVVDTLDNEDANIQDIDSSPKIAATSQQESTTVSQHTQRKSSNVDVPSASSISLSDDIDENALRVIRGEFGVGEARKVALGSSYEKIQERVNEIYRQRIYNKRQYKIRSHRKNG